MNEFTQILTELYKTEPFWEEQLINMERLDDLYNCTLSDSLSGLIGILRNFIKNCEENKIDEIKHLLKNPKTIDILLHFTTQTLMHYKNFSVLRNIEKDNSSIVSHFIQDSIENYVVRLDPQFITKYNIYMIQNTTEMKNILGSIDCLTEYYVRKLFNKNAILIDFEDETGLSTKNCELYAELVNNYFQELKMNLILQDTDYIKQILN